MAARNSFVSLGMWLLIGLTLHNVIAFANATSNQDITRSTDVLTNSFSTTNEDKTLATNQTVPTEITNITADYSFEINETVATTTEVPSLADNITSTYSTNETLIEATTSEKSVNETTSYNNTTISEVITEEITTSYNKITTEEIITTISEITTEDHDVASVSTTAITDDILTTKVNTTVPPTLTSSLTGQETSSNEPTYNGTWIETSPTTEEPTTITPNEDTTTDNTVVTDATTGTTSDIDSNPTDWDNATDENTIVPTLETTNFPTIKTTGPITSSPPTASKNATTAGITTSVGMDSSETTTEFYYSVSGDATTQSHKSTSTSGTDSADVRKEAARTATIVSVIVCLVAMSLLVIVFAIWYRRLKKRYRGRQRLLNLDDEDEGFADFNVHYYKDVSM